MEARLQTFYGGVRSVDYLFLQPWKLVVFSFDQKMMTMALQLSFSGIRWVVAALLLVVALADGLEAKPFGGDRPHTGQTLRDVYFVSPQVGVAVGYEGTIARTTDGGKSWHKVSCPTKRSLLAVDFVNKRVGFASGDRLTILRTDDGGRSWEKVERVDCQVRTSGLMDIKMLDGRRGFACGGQGVLLRTVDGGRSWERISLVLRNGLNAIHFLPGGRKGFVAGGKVLIRTGDGGKTWEKVPAPGINYQSVHFKDGQYGVMAGAGGKIAVTRDGGDSWEARQVGKDRMVFRSVVLRQDNSLLLSGNFQGLMVGRNLGESWQTLPLGIPGQGNTLFAIDVRQKYPAVVGASGYVFVYSPEEKGFIRRNYLP